MRPDPNEWVKAYAANIRHLGAQMGEATRKLEASRPPQKN